MGIIIKKVSRNTFISILSMGGLLLALISRLFSGGASLNDNSRSSEKQISRANLISAARADVISGGDVCNFDVCGGEGHEGTGGGGSGSSEGSAEGSGEGSGEGEGGGGGEGSGEGGGGF